MTYSMLDVCCGAGLSHDGYLAVGIRSAGVDIEDQPHYPGPFTKADALDVIRSDIPLHYDAIHTSFPCQLFTRAATLRTAQGGKTKAVDLLTPGLELLRTRWNHKPWVAENVDSPGVLAIMKPRPGEHLVRLCGSMFGLQVQRHRWFLSNIPLRQPTGSGPGKNRRLGCRHDTFPLDPVSGKPRPWGIYHVAGDSVPDGGRTCRDEEHGRQAMGSHRLLPWASLKEGFPPAYTAHVGADVVAELRLRGAGDRLFEEATA